MLAFWLTYSVRSFLRSGRRAVLAIVCVMVGAAGVVALETASLTVQQALTSNVRAANGGDISLTTDEVPLSPADLRYFQRLQRQRRISAWTAVASVHATAVSTSGRLVPFDVDLVTVPPYPLGGQPGFVSPSKGTVAGLLAHHGDVLVTGVLAQELGLSPGSRVLVNGVGGSGLHATVRGILAETSVTHAAAMTAEVRDIAAVTSSAPRYTAVYIDVPGSSDAVAALLRNRFPADTVQTVSQALQIAHQEVHDFHQFLLLVGLLALLIAGVGILNAMQSILAHRRLEIAMLKAVGFPESTLYVLFGVEAAIIGLIGGVLGTALGLGVSKLVTEVLAQAAGVQSGFVLDANTILSGILLAVGATLIFAVIPIVRASALRPLEVLQGRTWSTPGQWTRSALLLAMVFLLFGVLTAIVLADPMLAAEFAIGITAVCAVLVGLFSAAMAWLARLGATRRRATSLLILLVLVALTIFVAMRMPALAAILAVIALLYGVTLILPRRRLLPLLMGARSLSRRRSRTAMILVAFLAGVLAMTVTMTVALGLQGEVSAALAHDRSQSLVAISATSRGSTIVRASHGLRGIRSHTVMTTIAVAPVTINGRRPATYMSTLDADAQDDPRDQRLWALNGVTGWSLAQGELPPPDVQIVLGRALTRADAGSNHIILQDELLGYPYYLSPGATLTLRETGTGIVKSVRVVGFYSRPDRSDRFDAFTPPPIYGDQTLVRRLGGADAQTVVTFTADQKSLAYDAAMLQRALPGVLVIDVGDLTAILDTVLNDLLHLLAVLTALVLGAGVTVVANGVALAMLERRREIAVFKAVGFGPVTVQSFVLVENALIGTLAGATSVLLTAVALGLLSRFVLLQPIGFDPVLAVLILLIATAIAVATAYLAARTSTQVRPIEALRNE